MASPFNYSCCDFRQSAMNATRASTSSCTNVLSAHRHTSGTAHCRNVIVSPNISHMLNCFIDVVQN